MKNTKLVRTRGRLVSIRNSLLLLGMVAVSGVPFSPTYAQNIKPKSYQKQSVTTYPFSGYNQVGDTRIYYSQGDYIDIIGRFQDHYYGSTYSNRGYKVALKVNNGTAQMVSCNGAQLDGVKFNAWVEPQGELARICYAFTNTTDDEVTISAGTHADVMIGNNDRAPITRRKDTTGSTYGLTMSDGGGAQLCVLFGNGLKGVTSVNDFGSTIITKMKAPIKWLATIPREAIGCKKMAVMIAEWDGAGRIDALLLVKHSYYHISLE